MKKEQLKMAENAIKRIAEKDGVSVEYVKEQMLFAILSSFSSDGAKNKEFWNQIPNKGAFSTPEEFISFVSEQIMQDREL